MLCCCCTESAGWAGLESTKSVYSNSWSQTPVRPSSASRAAGNPIIVSQFIGEGNCLTHSALWRIHKPHRLTHCALCALCALYPVPALMDREENGCDPLRRSTHGLAYRGDRAFPAGVNSKQFGGEAASLPVQCPYSAYMFLLFVSSVYTG